MLWLIDSRSRSQTGKRFVYSLPVTIEGVRRAWRIVLAAECDDEDDRASYDGYAGSVGENALHEDIETFNTFWSEYGWHLVDTGVDDAELWHDMVLAVTDATGAPMAVGLTRDGFVAIDSKE